VTATELHRIEWNHPNLGRISETACLSHEGDVLRALGTLGIGCGGSLDTSGRGCDRCAHPGVPARVWLREGRP
jgi:hypothetical protein